MKLHVHDTIHEVCEVYKLSTTVPLSVYIILSLGNSRKQIEFSSCVVQKVTVCFAFVPSYTAFRKGRTNFQPYEISIGNLLMQMLQTCGCGLNHLRRAEVKVLYVVRLVEMLLT